MKIKFLFLFIFIIANVTQASCVNWSEIYRCDNGGASLHMGQSWCGGNKTAYHLTINSSGAKEHLGKLARTELTFLSLLPTENFGVFTSKVNEYVTAQVFENHQDSSLKVELFLDNKKQGEYIFYGCNF